jgi:HAD superfamily phosphatase (TIGR01668 family)
MLPFVAPHLRVESVLDLGVDRLADLGLDALLLDVDCTLKRYRAETVSAEVAAWLDALREAGIGLCLVSNGLSARIGRFAETVGLPFRGKSGKPLPFGLRAAVRKMGFDRRRTAMVGDQVFADVMAGRLAGLTTILVRPIHPEEERWFTRMKRPFERLVIGEW